METPNETLAFAAAFRNELAPQGPLETTLVNEIIYAAARLCRCADDDDRSRNFAHRILRNAISELRRLQTDRQIREELDPDLPAMGLASYRELIAAYNASATFDLRTRKQNGTDTISKIIDNFLPKPPAPPAPDPQNWVCSAKEDSAATPDTPRNAPCPCGSREKFKRCCGRTAPPVLGHTVSKPPDPRNEGEEYYQWSI